MGVPFCQPHIAQTFEEWSASASSDIHDGTQDEGPWHKKSAQFLGHQQRLAFH